MPITNNQQFPKNFLWGTATSSHQVEGGQKNDWTEWEPGKINDGSVSGQTCDHWNRYEQDFDLAKKLNNNAYRFSIEWSRIEPEQGKWDENALNHYRQMVKALLNKGLTPFATLHHFTNPVWLAEIGGWENPKAPELFATYCRKVVQTIPEIKFWTTFNETNTFVELGYASGYWPPQKKNIFKAYRVYKNMVKAHLLAYDTIRELNNRLKIGIAHNFVVFEPKHKWLFTDWIAAGLAHYWHNAWYLDKCQSKMDFVGINYYYRSCLGLMKYDPADFFKKTAKKNTTVSDFGWEIFPEGLGRAIKFYAKYKKPMYITENGLADAKDVYRTNYIHDHLQVLLDKISEGCDVRGYFHWSLLDNFEWREGFKMRFGLFNVDFKTQERKMRQSAEYYAKVCKENKLC